MEKGSERLLSPPPLIGEKGVLFSWGKQGGGSQQLQWSEIPQVG